MEVKRWNVYISYFYSLKNFYVHNTNDQKIIQEIALILQQNKELSILNCVKPGDIVAAKYDNDGLWYRAKIINLEENFTYTVQFIDYGNSEISSNFKKLPDELASYHAMAYHCMLDNVDEEEKAIIIDNDFYNIVFEFITSIEIVLTFLKNEEPFVVNMKWDKRDIKIYLKNIISYGVTPKTYEIQKSLCQPGSKMKVNVVFIKSTNEFYVETDDSEEIKNKIEYELVNRTVWEPVTEYEIGKLVIAKSETDNRWYRVRILEINQNKKKVNCYLIDYGVQDICSEFYEAIGYLESAQPFIKRCSLFMPSIKKNKVMSTSLSKSFIDEVELCKKQNMIITIIKTGEPYVVKLYIDGLNIAKLIKPKAVNIFNVRHINAFIVQINTSKRCALLCELNEIKNLTPVKKHKMENLYGAKINEKFYRVKIKNKLNINCINVIMVDMGGSSVYVDELFNLPEHLKSIKYLSLSCTLGLDERYYSTKKLRLTCDNGNAEFTMIILQSNIDGHHIQLFLNNENVTNMIKKD